MGPVTSQITESGDDWQPRTRTAAPTSNEQTWSVTLYCVNDLAVIDDIDRKILDLLRENARRSLRDIAAVVGLTVAPVQRRIARLEKLGVIERYTVQVNHGRIATGIEAMTELTFVDDLDLAQVLEFVAQIPEVAQVLTLAGDPDALVRIRVEGVEDLRRVVSQLRSGAGVASTKTLVVLEEWTRLG